MKNIILWFTSLLLVSCATNKTSVPKWYGHSSAVYPIDKFITGEGEGESSTIARERALSNLSLQFNTYVSSKNDLAVSFYETESDFSKDISLSEYTETKSQTQLLSVFYPDDFFYEGVYHSIAVIDREKSYDLYVTQINDNNKNLQTYLNAAGQKQNPILAYVSQNNAKKLLNENAVLVLCAKILKDDNNPCFTNFDSHQKNAKSIFEKNKKINQIEIHIENDFNNIIERTLKYEFEQLGFIVTSSKNFTGAAIVNGIADLRVTESSEAFFSYITLDVKISGPVQNNIFSYHRSFPKTGGLKKEQAIRLGFYSVAKEIKSTFANELCEKFGMQKLRLE